MTMSSECFEEESSYEPQRDRRGRFVKGSTGNPDGRPPKRPKPPKSLAKCLAEALDREVPVNDNGVPQLLTMRELLAASLLRGTVKAKPKDMLHILERTNRLAESAEDEDGPEEEIFTEEDRRLLALVREELGQAESHDDDASDPPSRSHFTFD